MRKKNWICMFCNQKYYTTCQICPKCRRIMQLEKNIGNKKMLLEEKR